MTTALLDCLEPAERRALFAHERAHLAARHHRFLLAVRLAARANPFLRPPLTAVSYTTERSALLGPAPAVRSRPSAFTSVGPVLILHAATPL